MYPSAHYLLFVNYEDFFTEIKDLSDQEPTTPSWFFSGYDCDSLALENLTRFAESALAFFQTIPQAHLELRTKSVATKVWKSTLPMENVVTAFSFTPQEISDQLENQVPSVSKRISAMKRLAEKGWKLGVRLDPIIDCQDFDKRYDSLISEIFDQVPSDSIHSVSLGPFRLPSPFFKKDGKALPIRTFICRKL